MSAPRSRLASAASPYLRAHAGNPVEWWAWGDEAFAEARRRDVPVLVSIGYSTCHWCHVMARESFADDGTAAEVNSGFVAVKVDREEHPDVDSAYLQAASAFTPHLGWPLTAFATPEGRVFYAGTYFPPEPRGGMPSFRQVLAAVTEAWRDRRDEVEQTASGLAEAMTRALAAASSPGELPDLPRLLEAVQRIVDREDRVHGGFAPADAPLESPKFPSVPVLALLQHPALRAALPGAAGVSERALAAMRGSELFDTVDGGFFRYATRRDWTEPHYERMLTDNAGLLRTALQAHDLDTAGRVAGFLLDVLQQPSGGFAAAQDSESWIDGARSEGGYYRRDGAARAGLDAPAIDAKIVTGWNGLAIGALAEAGAVLGHPRLVSAARTAADAVIETHLQADGSLRRASLDEVPSRAAAVLEDYGLLASGLVRLALAAGEPAYARIGRDLVDRCLENDDAPGGGDPVLATQGVPVATTATDGDHLSGRSSLVEACLLLWQLGAGDDYRVAASRLVAGSIALALSEPQAYAGILAAAVTLASSSRQLVVVGDPASPVAQAARSQHADILAIVDDTAAAAFAVDGFALFEGKSSGEGPALAYDCRDFACRLPTADPGALTA